MNQSPTPPLIVMGARQRGKWAHGSVLRDELVVLGCFALERRCRDGIRNVVPSRLFVNLTGQQALFAERVSTRNHECRPPALLDTQCVPLEPLAPDATGQSVDVAAPPDGVVRHFTKEVGQR